jgi:hypothetical protein
LVGFADNSGSRLPNVRTTAALRHKHDSCFGECVGYKICVASCQRHSVSGMADCKTTVPGVPRTSVVIDTLTSPGLGISQGLAAMPNQVPPLWHAACFLMTGPRTGT